MQNFKSVWFATLMLFMPIWLAGCSTSKLHRVAAEPSKIKRELQDSGGTTASATYSVRKANKPVNPILASITRSKFDREQVAKNAQFLSQMDLSTDIIGIFQAEKLFTNAKENEKPDLSVVISYGLSNDFQIAGVHAAVYLNGGAEEVLASHCHDQFEVVAHSGIPENEKPFMGKDVRLINSYSALRQLYRSMAKDVSSLIKYYYDDTELLNNPMSAKHLDMLTFDDRFHHNALAVDMASRVVAFKKGAFNKEQCGSVLVFSFDKAHEGALGLVVRKEQQVHHREESQRRYEYRQQERNRRLTQKRLIDKIRNK